MGPELPQVAIPSQIVRLDKWLWTSRLFKTRSLAAGAVTGGRVHVNGAAVKPSREVGPGDELAITIGPVRRTVIVRGAAVIPGLLLERDEFYTLVRRQHPPHPEQHHRPGFVESATKVPLSCLSATSRPSTSSSARHTKPKPPRACSERSRY